MPDFDLDAALARRPDDEPVISPCCGAVMMFDRIHWPEWHRGEAYCRCATCRDEFLLTYLTAEEEVQPRCPTDGHEVKWSGTVTAGGTWPISALAVLYDQRICPACGITPVAYRLSGDPIPL